MAGCTCLITQIGSVRVLPSSLGAARGSGHSRNPDRQKLKNLVKHGLARSAKPVARSGKALPRIRWTLERAAVEFGTDSRVLLRKLERSGAHPDKGGTWTTRAILDALYDDQYRRRSELLAVQAEKVRLLNEVRRRTLIPVAEVKAIWHKTATVVRPLIIAMNGPDADKHRVFSELSKIEAEILCPPTRKQKTGTR
jgi:hypothetical protein